MMRIAHMISMSEFDTLCDKMAAKSVDEKMKIINDLTPGIIKALNDVTEDGVSGVSIYTDFILCAVAADGKLAKEEFDLLEPLFEAVSGGPVTFEEAQQIFKENGLDDPAQYKKTVDMMLDVIGLVSDDLKNAIVIVCLLICAIDGEVSADEKEWIKQLVDDNFGMTPVEQVDAVLTQAGTFVLATSVDGQPRMRVLGFKTMMDEKIYFGIGTFKDVYAQLKANPRCEILGSCGAQFVRWDGNAVFSDDQRLPMAFAAALPEIAQTYADNKLTLAFFTLEGGSAEIVGVDNTKKKLF